MGVVSTYGGSLECVITVPDWRDWDTEWGCTLMKLHELASSRSNLLLLVFQGVC